jgi:uncharacterized protein
MARLRCPLCNAPLDTETCLTPPFCSERCQQIDLKRWLNEEYTLPIYRDPEDDEEFEDPERE